MRYIKSFADSEKIADSWGFYFPEEFKALLPDWEFERLFSEPLKKASVIEFSEEPITVISKLKKETEITYKLNGRIKSVQINIMESHKAAMLLLVYNSLFRQFGNRPIIVEPMIAFEEVALLGCARINDNRNLARLLKCFERNKGAFCYVEEEQLISHIKSDKSKLEYDTRKWDRLKAIRDEHIAHHGGAPSYSFPFVDLFYLIHRAHALTSKYRKFLLNKECFLLSFEPFREIRLEMDNLLQSNVIKFHC